MSAYTAISAYQLASSSQPTVIYGDAGASAPPTAVTQPFPGYTSASDGVVNVSAGGQFRLFKNRSLRLHGSVANNQSPVGEADQIFTRADLFSWTLGVSGGFKKFQFSAGVNSKSGTSDNVKLRNLLSGQTVNTTVDIRTLGFIYSIAYQF